MIRVREITLYPVKGLGGISLQQAIISRSGLQYDRHWMVTRDDGRFVTQRDLPSLATIGTRLSDQGLTLTRPGLPDFSAGWPMEGETLESRVWKDACRVAAGVRRYGGLCCAGTVAGGSAAGCTQPGARYVPGIRRNRAAIACTAILQDSYSHSQRRSGAG